MSVFLALMELEIMYQASPAHRVALEAESALAAFQRLGMARP